LNNTAPAHESVADRVALLDERGCLSDEMSYEGGAPSGYSLERRDLGAMGDAPSNWGVSAIDGGTPLAANSLLVPPRAAGIQLSSRVWRRERRPPRLQGAD